MFETVSSQFTGISIRIQRLPVRLHFLCCEPLIKMIVPQSLWHIIIWNRCMHESVISAYLSALPQQVDISGIHFQVWITRKAAQCSLKWQLLYLPMSFHILLVSQFVSLYRDMELVPGSVTLIKDSQNLIGISIGGGAPLCPCLYIVQVFDNTPAAKDGSLAAGDEIVGVGGKSVKGRTKVEVARMIQSIQVRFVWQMFVCLISYAGISLMPGPTLSNHLFSLLLLALGSGPCKLQHAFTICSKI